MTNNDINHGMRTRKKKVALDALSSPYNSFINSFAKSVRDTGAITIQAPYHLVDLRRIDCIIYHWPYLLDAKTKRYFAIKAVIHLMLARKLFGLKVIWVAHNAVPHEGSSHKFISRLFFSQLDGIIYLSERSKEIVRERNPIYSHTNEFVTVHGIFETNTPVHKIPSLKIDEHCRLLCFGLIRPYKGLGELLSAASHLKGGIRLTILGKIHDLNYARELVSTAQANSNVHLDIRDELVSDDELEAAIDKSHGVVLPYRKILNSGAAIHSLSRNRPVLVPNQGSMPELQRSLGTRWVKTFDDQISVEDIERFAEAIRGTASDERIDMRLFAWQRVTENLTNFFTELGVGLQRKR